MSETMGRCRDCRWWACWSWAPIGGDEYVCKRGHGTVGSPSDTSSLAWGVAYDPSGPGYMATRAGFGCVQFTAKAAGDE